MLDGLALNGFRSRATSDTGCAANLLPKRAASEPIADWLSGDLALCCDETHLQLAAGGTSADRKLRLQSGAQTAPIRQHTEAAATAGWLLRRGDRRLPASLEIRQTSLQNERRVRRSRNRTEGMFSQAPFSTRLVTVDLPSNPVRKDRG